MEAKNDLNDLDLWGNDLDLWGSLLRSETV